MDTFSKLMGGMPSLMLATTYHLNKMLDEFGVRALSQHRLDQYGYGHRRCCHRRCYCCDDSGLK